LAWPEEVVDRSRAAADFQSGLKILASIFQAEEDLIASFAIFERRRFIGLEKVEVKIAFGHSRGTLSSVEKKYLPASSLNPGRLVYYITKRAP
jgi:hypothetical protein